MKKQTILIAALMLLALPLTAERVTPETARQVATTFLQNNGAKTAQIADLSQSAGFENLYIFTTESSFVVMTADDRVQPILGYSLTGKFVAENMTSNVSWWLQGYNEEIQYAIDSKMKASAEIAQLWKDLTEGNTKAAKTTAEVNALLQTTWDQNGYYYYNNGQLLIYELYNNLCPYDSNAGERTVTGCVATAMAQIMKYWGYPSQGMGSHSYTPETRPDLGVQSADFGATAYQWGNMPNALSSNSTETEINAIATLMYHCGVSVNMMYDISSHGGSSAYAEDIPNALINYFNYKTTASVYYKENYSNTNWINLLKAELDASRPVEYNGSGSAGGHAFVCDGYDNNNNFHFNWGWSGQNDGFFALTSLNPGSGGAGGGSYNFTNGQSAVFGIEPASTMAAPTNLTLTTNEAQEIILNWVGVSNASSYNVYRNNNLIGNTTSTTYSEIPPFGTNAYFVRAVDSNGQQSLPSNTVTITIEYPTPVVNDLTASLTESNINLSWTAPSWCYPEAPSATLTYGDGNMNGRNSAKYWAHRYLSNNISQYSGKAVYKISFYAYETGSYICNIYKGTTMQVVSGEDVFFPTTLLTSKTIAVTTPQKWIDVDLDELVTIDGQDLWIIMNDPVNNSGRYTATFSNNTGSNNHSYWGRWTMGDGRKGYVLNEDYAWLIKTYLTDGTYTYNLYQDGTAIVEDLSSTTYNANLNNNATNLFTVKTNYYGGETEASNKIGFAKGNATISSLELGANDQMTLTANSILNVSNTLTNANPANLVIENGAQLIHSGEGVQATIKKDIEAYTSDDNGWYSLATPFTTYNPEGELTLGSYDLYAYDEDGNDEGKEWINYEANTFNLTASTGYIYANSETGSFSMTGTLNSGTYSQTVNLSYANSNNNIKGYNLLGNPTAHEINFSKTSNVSDGYYYLDNGNLWTYSPESTVPAGRGFLVKANASGQSVTLNPQSKDDSAENGQYISVSIGDNMVYIKLNEGVSMPQFDLRGRHNRLYLSSNHKHYAMLVRNGAETVDLCFEPSSNGMQTLIVDTQGLDLDYLHLIDNFTGADIDLLALRQAQVPTSYDFETNTSDNASRFKLVFAENDMSATTAADNFAYVSSREIVVSADACDATLQIVDMKGQIVASFDGRTQYIPTSRMASGVYILRLITADGVKTQKIVVE